MSPPDGVTRGGPPVTPLCSVTMRQEFDAGTTSVLSHWLPVRQIVLTAVLVYVYVPISSLVQELCVQVASVDWMHPATKNANIDCATEFRILLESAMRGQRLT